MDPHNPHQSQNTHIQDNDNDSSPYPYTDPLDFAGYLPDPWAAINFPLNSQLPPLPVYPNLPPTNPPPNDYNLLPLVPCPNLTHSNAPSNSHQVSRPPPCPNRSTANTPPHPHHHSSALPSPHEHQNWSLIPYTNLPTTNPFSNPPQHPPPPPRSNEHQTWPLPPRAPLPLATVPPNPHPLQPNIHHHHHLLPPPNPRPHATWLTHLPTDGDPRDNARITAFMMVDVHGHPSRQLLASFGLGTPNWPWSAEDAPRPGRVARTREDLTAWRGYLGEVVRIRERLGGRGDGWKEG